MVLGEKHGTNYLPYTLRTYHKIKKSLTGIHFPSDLSLTSET